jgi:5-methylcytosine-specific restriction endonuclease McrA
MNIEEAIATSNSMSEAARKLNMPFMTFKRKAGNLYKPNQAGKNIPKPSKKKIPLLEILNGLHPQYQSNMLRIRLIAEGIKEHKCECCGNHEWLGSAISLEVDHINGNSKDHILENLRILCPNCHAQTDTYRGKNIKK